MVELEGLIMVKFVLAYPELNESDFKLIQAFREKYDVLFFKRVLPHFTLLISESLLSENDFKDEIQSRSEHFTSFEICLRSAVLNKDRANESFNVFLVPDEGESRIIKMQEALYSGKFKDQRLSILDLNPNIGVGTSDDFHECLKMAEIWNQNDFEIRGRVSVLDLVEFDGKTIRTFEQLRLNFQRTEEK